MFIKKRYIKIIFITIILIIFSFFVCQNICFAKIDLVKEVKPKDNGATSSFKAAMNIIVSIFQVVAIGVAVIMLTSLAIKYMVSSVNDKAEIKKHATVYIVGAIIAFSSSGILEILKQFVVKNLKN